MLSEKAAYEKCQPMEKNSNIFDELSKESQTASLMTFHIIYCTSWSLIDWQNKMCLVNAYIGNTLQ